MPIGIPIIISANSPMYKNESNLSFDYLVVLFYYNAR